MATNFSAPQCLSISPVTWHSSFSTKWTTISSIIVLVVQIIFIPFVIFLNGSVLFLIAKFEVLREKRFLVLGLLSITDLLNGLIAQPLLVAKELYHLVIKEVNCALDTAFIHVSTLLWIVSLYQLACLTYERNVAITDPFNYNQRISISKLLFITAANLVGHFVFGLFYRLIPSIQFYVFVILAPMIISCFLAIIYWNIRIFALIKKHKRNITKLQKSSAAGGEGRRQKCLSERRMVITMAYLFGTFLITYIPVIVDNIYVQYNENEEIRTPLYFALQLWADLFVHLNSLISPLIYGLRTNKFRGYFLRCFCGIEQVNDFVEQEIELQVRRSVQPQAAQPVEIENESPEGGRS